ncbi:MAG: hypothetical protein KDD61_17970 [Bdellovibrionales bacterium]|nr:hypothetical protein [Bdellovibrionales bacterium]
MKYLLLALILCGSFVTLPTHASDNASREVFSKGIGAFQKKEFSEASKLFAEVLREEPNNPSALYNWGLSLYQEGKVGQALAAWRRSQALSPFSGETRKALKFAKEHVSTAGFGDPDSEWETFRSWLLVPVSFSLYATLTLVFLLIGGVPTLKYFAARKFALLEDQPLPKTPLKGFFSLFLFSLFVILAISKAYDLSVDRATVVTEKVAVYTAPSSDDNQVFELLEGMEVFPLRTEGEWVQISSLGGLSGWIQKGHLYYTSGRQLW